MDFAADSWYSGHMSFLDQYDRDERPIARKVLFDLAVHQVGVFHDRLNHMVQGFPGDSIDHIEAREIATELTAAERVLGMATDSVGSQDWPWSSTDFEDFWHLGGSAEEAVSMLAYLAKMPDFFRTVMEAQSMPAEYAQPLLDGVPKWHN